jgi:tetratricopeptide (TPR) repeat protein
LLGAVFLAGCGSSDSEVPILHTQQDYDTQLEDVQKLTLGPFTKFDSGHSLSMKEESELRQAQMKVEGLIGYDPEFNNYFIAGKIAYTLGQYTTAIQSFNQCVQQPLPKGASNDQYTRTLSEAHYLSSLCFFNLRDYAKAADEAAIAAHYVPESALYLVAGAQALVQLNRDKDAEPLLLKALKLDPRNDKAAQLLLFIRRHPQK